jgi:hypothetical protein
VAPAPAAAPVPPAALQPHTTETALSLPRETSAQEHETKTPVSTYQEIAVAVPWRQVLLMQLPATIAALLGGPLVIVVVLLVLRRSGFMFRVEVVNPLGQVVGLTMPRLGIGPSHGGGSQERLEAETGLDHSSPHVSASQSEGPEAPPEEPMTGEQFDLGPTYEEEKRQQEEGLKQQELAVLQQIFEENKQLQKELRRLKETTPNGGETAAPVSVPTEGPTDASRTVNGLKSGE